MKNPMKICTGWSVVCAAALLFVAGCGREEAPAPVETPAPPAPAVEEKPVDPVVARMNDPVYVGKLNKQFDQQKAILRDLAAAKARKAKAEEAGASEEELAAAKAEVQAVYDRLEANRLKSQAIVGAQMRGQTGPKK